MKSMNIYVTTNENYIPQLSVMLTSLYINNPGERFDIFLAHKGIPEKRLKDIENVLLKFGYGFFPILVNSSLLSELPVNKHHPQEIYYKLFASELLPKNIDKALYLDPDLLVINPIRPLYEMDMGGKAFAAASHSQKKAFFIYQNSSSANTATGFFNLKDLNLQGSQAVVDPITYQIKTPANLTAKDYNSGVVLINLLIARRETDLKNILKFVKTYNVNLASPDSDVLGLMYGNKTTAIDSLMWNYNAKNYAEYLAENENLTDTNWIMKNTSIIHFCGNNKPWKDIYRHRFGLLYKHYMQIASRFFTD